MRISPQSADPPPWLASAAAWLSPRRLRAHAIVLAVCLWGICAVDFSTAGPFDRAGNIKFQDFLPFYVSARLIAQDRANELYNQPTAANEMDAAVQEGTGQPLQVTLPYLYGPQVGLLFVPLSHLSFPVAARLWVTLSLLIVFACVYRVLKSCPELRPHAATVAVAALAFPPLYHFFVRAQISALPLAVFTAAFFAFRARREMLAGAILGVLIFKPQFLIALPLVLLLSQAWRAFATLTLSAGVQLVLTKMYFGPGVMRAYFDTLTHTSRWIASAELPLASVQMHSLRSFWSLLIPRSLAAFGLYVLTACIVVAIAARIWKSSAPLALRFSALTLAAVLVNPHLFIYDLLVLVPILMLLANWILANAAHPSSAALRVLLYLAFILPLFGPLARWTHLQLSVPIFVALLWMLLRTATPGHKLDSSESGVV